jgi:hypothetical protein
MKTLWGSPRATPSLHAYLAEIVPVMIYTPRLTMEKQSPLVHHLCMHQAHRHTASDLANPHTIRNQYRLGD